MKQMIHITNDKRKHKILDHGKTIYPYDSLINNSPNGWILSIVAIKATDTIPTKSNIAASFTILLTTFTFLLISEPTLFL